MRKRRYPISVLIFKECGAEMYVPRTRHREKDHIKTMYCWKCMKVTDHVEKEDQVRRNP